MVVPGMEKFSWKFGEKDVSFVDVSEWLTNRGLRSFSSIFEDMFKTSSVYFELCDF